MSLSDIPEGGILELAGYLRGFPPHDEDAEQYWYLLACELRQRNTTNYNYSQNVRYCLPSLPPWLPPPTPQADT